MNPTQQPSRAQFPFSSSGPTRPPSLPFSPAQTRISPGHFSPHFPPARPSPITLSPWPLHHPARPGRYLSARSPALTRLPPGPACRRNSPAQARKRAPSLADAAAPPGSSVSPRTPRARTTAPRSPATIPASFLIRGVDARSTAPLL